VRSSFDWSGNLIIGKLPCLSNLIHISRKIKNEENMIKLKDNKQLLLILIVLAITALGCQFINELFTKSEDGANNQSEVQPDRGTPDIPSEEEDFQGALNAAGPDRNDEVELNIGGIQLFYNPNLIGDIQGEWQKSSGSNMNNPYPAYMHYDLILDAGTISLVAVSSLEYVSYSLELALDELEGLLMAQPTAGLDCIPEVSKDSSIQNCDHQQFVSNIKYLDFKNGTGVRWVTVYAIQDARAVSNEFLVYRFQGLSHNGECYLKASFRLTHNDLPDNAMIPNDVYADASGVLLQEYFANFQSLLNNNPGGYQPSVEHFDAIIESLAVGKCAAG
jgi:hypothetical protein